MILDYGSAGWHSPKDATDVGFGLLYHFLHERWESQWHTVRMILES